MGHTSSSAVNDPSYPGAKKTFDGFMRFVVIGTVSVIVLLIGMAVFLV